MLQRYTHGIPRCLTVTAVVDRPIRARNEVDFGVPNVRRKGNKGMFIVSVHEVVVQHVRATPYGDAQQHE